MLTALHRRRLSCHTQSDDAATVVCAEATDGAATPPDPPSAIEAWPSVSSSNDGASDRVRLCVVFDLDDTKIFSERATLSALARARAASLPPPLLRNAALDVVLDRDGTLRSAACASTQPYLAYDNVVQPRRGAADLLASLIDAGCTVAIWSYGERAWVETNLRHLIGDARLRRLVFWRDLDSAVLVPTGDVDARGRRTMRRTKALRSKWQDPFLAGLGFAPHTTILVDDTDNVIDDSERAQWLAVPRATGDPDDQTLPRLRDYLLALCDASRRQGFDVRRVGVNAWKP